MRLVESPLAIKVVGQLVRSGDLPVAELLEELSIDPVSTLSEDSFTSDEQLKRCIDLSYKYLSPVGQSCFLFATKFLVHLIAKQMSILLLT